MKNAKLTDAYIASAADIQSMVALLQRYADNLHDVDPDRIEWANVGDLERVKVMLSGVIEITNQHEEHA